MIRQIKFCNTVLPDLGMVNKRVQGASELTGQLSNFGVLYNEFCQRLEEKLSLSPGRKLLVTSSGHTALMASYKCLGIKSILVPCYTFESTRVAASLQGINVKIVDVDPRTGCLDLNRAADIPDSEYDGMVVVAPLSSIPNLPEYAKFCHNKKKKLIIDGAATFGTPDIYNYGDIYCLSFHATKSFPLGEGGAVLCKRNIADNIKRYLNFGLERKIPNGFGINGKVSEYTSALGLGLLEEVGYHIRERQTNAVYLAAILKSALGNEISFLQSWKGDSTVYQSLPIYIENSRKLIRFLWNSGIECIKYYRPLEINGRFPNTFELYSKNICLPIHSDLKKEDFDYIVNKMVEFRSSNDR
jgi:dTDP-4-amino-4,6-dideoxygalactose transaminase